MTNMFTDSKKRSQKAFLVLIILLFTLIYITIYVFNVRKLKPHHTNLKVKKSYVNWRGLSEKEMSELSVLGRILFLEEDPPQNIVQKQSPYTILIWNDGEKLEARHIKKYTKHKFGPLENCSVKNCEISYNQNSLPVADVVLFPIQRLKGPKQMPSLSERPSYEQIWVMLTDESPYHIFMSGEQNLKAYNGLFNWTMSYKMHSDVPVPYGRTVLLETENPIHTHSGNRPSSIVNNSRTADVAILCSNCAKTKNGRIQYVKEIQEYLPVDFYGRCGTKKCPGHFNMDCPLLQGYKFYLSFENSNCVEYITEKVWWNAYHNNAVPVIMGAPIKDCYKLLPPGSFLHVDDFSSPRSLAYYMEYLIKFDKQKYEEFFQWKNAYQVLNEHGYFGSQSYHYCRLCEAMNYNSKNNKVYNDLESFMNAKRDCT